MSRPIWNRPPVDVHHGGLLSEVQVARGSESERRETAHAALDQMRGRRHLAARHVNAPQTQRSPAVAGKRDRMPIRQPAGIEIVTRRHDEGPGLTGRQVQQRNVARRRVFLRRFIVRDRRPVGRQGYPQWRTRGKHVRAGSASRLQIDDGQRRWTAVLGNDRQRGRARRASTRRCWRRSGAAERRSRAMCPCQSRPSGFRRVRCHRAARCTSRTPSDGRPVTAPHVRRCRPRRSGAARR